MGPQGLGEFFFYVIPPKIPKDNNHLPSDWLGSIAIIIPKSLNGVSPTNKLYTESLNARLKNDKKQGYLQGLREET